MSVEPRTAYDPRRDTGRQCAWDMSAQERTAWNAHAEQMGTPTVAQQERLGRIYIALREALEERVDLWDEESTWVDRRVRSQDSVFLLEQDAYRVLFGHEGAIGWTWRHDGTFLSYAPRGLTMPHLVADVVANALGRLG
jgi:hypothetical protein